MLLVFVLAMISYAQIEVDGNLLQKRNGVFYMPNEEKSFTGLAIWKYENGQIMGEGNYIDGEKNGEYILYDKKGRIGARSNYIDDKLNGEFITYYSNGQIEIKGNYIDDKEDGKWILYNRNGQSIFKRYYIDGIIQYETKEN